MDYLVEHINIENCFKAHVFTNEEKEYIKKNQLKSTTIIFSAAIKI